MNNIDHTLTSPVATLARHERPLLCMTIVWHPDCTRVGEQFIVTDDTLELSRYVPLFCQPGRDGLGLGHGGVSREPLRITRTAQDTLYITPPNSRMAVELNGHEITGPQMLGSEQVAAGAMLGLGRAVMVCLHFMRCLPKNNPIDGWIGVGESAIKTRDLIHQVAKLDAAVLLLGETGTGKEVAARALHNLSHRAKKPLVSVNMAALNESLAAADLFGASKGAYTGAQTARNGLFQEAQDATLFLDEIGNTPASVQPMLLRVLETGDFRPLGASQDLHSSARLITATDQDLYGGNFNQALLRRLESIIIHIPPLRARREDIGLLIVHLLQASRLPGATNAELPFALISRFANYDWPGNVRQLTHVLKRVLLAQQIGDHPTFENLVDVRLPGSAAGHAMAAAANLAAAGVPAAGSPAAGSPAVPAASPLSAPVRKKLADITEQDVLQAMQNNDWYIQGAAQELGISRPSMYKLLESHSQIRRPDQIDAADIRHALANAQSDVEACAAALKTPSEALRRHLRTLGLGA
jgi:two-component system nitrogen regulation response regulator GlnG